MKTWSLIVALAVAGMPGCNPAGNELLKTEAREKETSIDCQNTRAFEEASHASPDVATTGIIRQYGPTIKRYSIRYGLDWRLVLAVMKCESGFDEYAESHRGAWGFMQLMPRTGEEVGRMLSINVSAGPSDNIHGGVYYLRSLYDFFQSAEPTERLKLTLAAYNAGIGRIYDAQDIAAYLLEDPNRWESIRDALPLLSKRYYTLHSKVWKDERPRSGWFGKSDETVAYVERIMDYYDEYRQMLY